MMNNPKEINIDSMLIAIAKMIKEQKEALNLTVAELSEKSGVSVGVISDLINNRGRVPSLANFAKLAIALELPEDMFTGLIMGKIEEMRDSPFYQQVLSNLRKIMRDKNLTQEALAEYAEIGASQFSKVMNGTVGLSLLQFSKLARGLSMREIDIITYPNQYFKPESCEPEPVEAGLARRRPGIRGRACRHGLYPVQKENPTLSAWRL